MKKLDAIQVTLILLMALFAVDLVFTFFETTPINNPVELTRQVILTCTVKSNIDGVITLNDECDLKIIGEK